MAPPAQEVSRPPGHFFAFLAVKGASVHPCLKNIGRVSHALQIRPLFSEPRANYVVTPI
jgi:hypothetical protein